jgi:effector-binding domain-containing protein
LKSSEEQRFASFKFIGKLEEIYKGYEEMEEEMVKAGLKRIGPLREVYHEMSDFSKVTVEILYPIE